MINISEIVQGAGWKNFMKYLYGWGACMVIVGALFKLQHWKGAGTMLTIGMTVEAVIFFFSAFEPIHEEVDWTLVYPELAGMSDDEELDNYRNRGDGLSKEDLTEILGHFAGGGGLAGGAVGAGQASEQAITQPAGTISSAGGGNGALVFSQKFDEMLESAEIGPELFEKVSKGLRNLSNTASELGSISEAAKATEDFNKTLVNASESINQDTQSLSNNYNGLGESVGILTESYQRAANNLESSGNGFIEKISNTGEEFNSLILESGRNIASDISNSASSLVESYNDLSGRMKGDLENVETASKSYQEQLSIMNKNVEALNAVHEMNLQMVNSQVEEAKDVFSGMNELHSNMKESIVATSEYKEQVDNLNKNLQELNNIYGNMLSALDVVK